MSSDRPVHTDALATLGTIIKDTEKRDAIHIAVEPVKAGERLWPGDHVYLIDSVAFRANRFNDTNQGVGIVDPFLESAVEQGQHFWLLVYPRQITSLRHVWEHPSFPNVTDEEVTNRPKISKELAKEWLVKNLCDEDYANLDDYVVGILEGTAGYDGYLVTYGTNLSGDIPNEFWDYIEVYTGKKVPDSRKENYRYFSCTC